MKQRKTGLFRKLRAIVWESAYFYLLVIKMIFADRCFMSGAVLLISAPYILVINAIMHFVPSEYQDKVLPFVYTMQ